MRTAAAALLGITFVTFLCLADGRVEVEWACRDRYLWIHVISKETVQFEAIDPNGVHPISNSVASRCGYTVSAFKESGYSTFRASYYSCFTVIQDDQVFTFQFNVMVSDGGSEWVSQPVSAVCSGLSLVHREIVCEEDYMEVNVQREASCAVQPGPAGKVAQALKAASTASQLMFLQGDGQLTPVSITEAESRGYSLTLTAGRAVLRAPYKAAAAQLIQVDGVPVVVVSVFLFYKRHLIVTMIDMSMACTVNSASYDGEQLVWDVPRVLRPLLDEDAAVQSLKHRLEVAGVMLDEQSAAAKGFNLVRQEKLVQILVPFGAEGGYRESLVVNNVYKETFVISLLYEHRFSVTYQDGSSVETKLRILRVLQTPLICRPPFSIDQTNSDEEVFSFYLGNIPSDVVLKEVKVNKKELLEATGSGLIVTPVVHLNGSRAYKLRLPFSDAVVQRTYMGAGVVQYSIDVNFTLTRMPQTDSYYHNTLITAQVFSAYPPKITAQCLDRGILFSVVMPPGAESLWEVGVDSQPLTTQLADQRGYKRLNDSQEISLEVPVFSIGYSYEDINLSNFYGTFKLLLRDARTLEVQTSTSKHCLFKTEDLIVCSADGTITVVTTPTATWPKVQPESTSLLDPTCRPKQTDATRVLFEFKLDSCGTRTMVGDYMVYENEILHDRQLIADGPNFISRDSQFKLTVRCFYPLSGINRLTADRVSRAETPGFGSIDVFGSLTDPKNLPPDCLPHVSRIEMIPSETEQTQGPGKAGSLATPGPSHSVSVPGHTNEMDVNSQNQQTATKRNEYVPTPPIQTTVSPQGQLEDGFHLKYDDSTYYSRFQPSQQIYGLNVAKKLYGDSVSNVKRVEDSAPIRNWSPVSQSELIKLNEPQWSLKEPSVSQQGPFHTDINQHRRPGNTPHIYSSKRIPVSQIPAESIQPPNKPLAHDQSVQNIRIKPHRRLTFQNPNQRIYSQSSGQTVVGNAKHQTQDPEGTKLFDQPANWQRLAETRNSPGRKSPNMNVIQVAGPSQSMTEPAHGGFLPPAPRWSDRMSSLSGPEFSDQELPTRYMDAMEGNIGSTGSQPGAKGVDSRTSDQRDCRGLAAQHGTSVHQGIIRAMEGFERATAENSRLSSKMQR
ncbi:uncharacterized protein LOC144039865 [Vanacampus margaritifer]